MGDDRQHDVPAGDDRQLQLDGDEQSHACEDREARACGDRSRGVVLKGHVRDSHEAEDADQGDQHGEHRAQGAGSEREQPRDAGGDADDGQGQNAEPGRQGVHPVGHSLIAFFQSKGFDR